VIVVKEKILGFLEEAFNSMNSNISINENGRKKLYLGEREWHNKIVGLRVVYSAVVYAVLLLFTVSVWDKSVSGRFGDEWASFVILLIFVVTVHILRYLMFWRYTQKDKIYLSLGEALTLHLPVVVYILWMILYFFMGQLYTENISFPIAAVSIYLLIACAGVHSIYVKTGRKVAEFTVCADEKLIHVGDVMADGGITIEEGSLYSYSVNLLKENLYICDNGDLLIARGHTMLFQGRDDMHVFSVRNINKLCIQRKNMPAMEFHYTNRWELGFSVH